MRKSGQVHLGREKRATELLRLLRPSCSQFPSLFPPFYFVCVPYLGAPLFHGFPLCIMIRHCGTHVNIVALTTLAASSASPALLAVHSGPGASPTAVLPGIHYLRSVRHSYSLAFRTITINTPNKYLLSLLSSQ